MRKIIISIIVLLAVLLGVFYFLDLQEENIPTDYEAEENIEGEVEVDIEEYQMLSPSGRYGVKLGEIDPSSSMTSLSIIDLNSDEMIFSEDFPDTGLKRFSPSENYFEFTHTFKGIMIIGAVLDITNRELVDIEYTGPGHGNTFWHNDKLIICNTSGYDGHEPSITVAGPGQWKAANQHFIWPSEINDMGFEDKQGIVNYLYTERQTKYDAGAPYPQPNNCKVERDTLTYDLDEETQSFDLSTL